MKGTNATKPVRIKAETASMSLESGRDHTCLITIVELKSSWWRQATVRAYGDAGMTSMDRFFFAFSIGGLDLKADSICSTLGVVGRSENRIMPRRILVMPYSEVSQID